MWNNHRSQTTPKLQDVILVARPNLSSGEFQELQELTEYRDIFAMDSDDYGRTNGVYHHVDTGQVRPIHQPPRRRK
jgi:hypothetical protein